MSQKAETGVAVGIDLGTTNSLIGVVQDGRPVLLSDRSGADLLPSVVGIDADGKLVVGRAAKNRRLLDPAHTIASVKRRMGEDVKLALGSRELSPPEVSAVILASLLDRAEAKLGVRPTRAVITVPAYFDDAQRQATRDAGRIAGLVVERLVNEPTAAAMMYRTGQEQTVLVYDLGGGTFDVSILERDEGLLEVRTSHGDTRLGGDDIDRALTELVLGRIGAAKALIEADLKAMTRLVEAVERAKIALSEREEVRLVEPFLAGEGARAVHLDLVLTRADVADVARPFIERTLACIDAALRDLRMRPDDLDRVLLVGGASKMPVVPAMVSAHLGLPARLDLDADRAVALGASLLAGRQSGEAVEEILVDITPHTLAVGVLDPDGLDDHDLSLVAEPVIPRGTVVPVERRRSVMTVVENQRIAELPVVQGEEPYVEDNTQLGRVRVEDLPPSPAHSEVEVVFRLDLSGVLHVAATHVASGRRADVRIADSPYALTAQRQRTAQANLEELRENLAPEHGALGEENTASATESDLSLARAMLARSARALAREGIAHEPAERAKTAARALELAVERRDVSTSALTDELSDALLDLV